MKMQTNEKVCHVSLYILFDFFLSRYTVMAGSPAKMLEHLLETRLDGRDRSSVDATGRRSSAAGDTDSFLEEFLMTHIIFMPIHQLLTELQRQYPFHTKTTNGDGGSGSNATSPTSATNPTTYRDHYFFTFKSLKIINL